jgi:hypothetical protein
MSTWARGTNRLLGNRTGIDGGLQRPFDQAEAVLGRDLPPAVPTEHRGSVEQNNSLCLRLGAGLQEHLRPGPHRSQRGLRRRGERAGGDSLSQLGLDLLVYGLEEISLAVEVVVQRSSGDAGGADDLFRADAGVTVCGKKRARRVDQRRSGRLRSLRLGPFDIHTVCMYLTASVGPNPSPQEDAMSQSDQRREVDLPAGRIRYREAGEGKPVVFIHGYLVDGRLWDGVVDRLSDRCRCIAPDWPIGSQQIAMKPGCGPFPIRDRGDRRRLPRGTEPRRRDDRRQRLGRRDVAGPRHPSAGPHRPASSSPIATTHENFPPGPFKAMPPIAKLPGGWR